MARRTWLDREHRAQRRLAMLCTIVLNNRLLQPPAWPGVATTMNSTVCWMMSLACWLMWNRMWFEWMGRGYLLVLLPMLVPLNCHTQSICQCLYSSINNTHSIKSNNSNNYSVEHTGECNKKSINNVNNIGD